MTYYISALSLFLKADSFANETRSQVLVKILKRQYRLHWLRQAVEQSA